MCKKKNAGTGWGSGAAFHSVREIGIVVKQQHCVCGEFTDLSTQSESLEQWLEAGASCPPTAYRKLLYVATPTPPLLLDIGAHMLHLLVCGSKHSIDLKHELPSRPPTANSLRNKREKIIMLRYGSAKCNKINLDK